MYVTTLIIMLVILLLSTDDDVKLIIFFSACAFSADLLFSLSMSQYYFQRHIIQDLVLALLCFWFKRKDFNWAGMICIISSMMMLFEYLHTYKSPIYYYLATIQIVLMQLYLLALTYKSEWRIPQCLSRQRKL